MPALTDHSARGDASKKTRASRVAEELRRAILAGDFVPGEKVNLDQMRARFGVSLSPMREAISRLVADELVQFEDQRGYRIAPVSRANLAEVTRLRADLESLALRHAIAAASIEWEADLLAALHRSRRDAHGDTEAACGTFHAALSEGCPLPMLVRYCATLRALHLRYGHLLGFTDPGRDFGAEHAAIAEAAIARNAELAPALLKQDIERTGRRMTGLMPADDPDPKRTAP